MATQDPITRATAPQRDKIFLRVFAEVPDSSAARATAQALQQTLSQHGRICRSSLQRYWKIDAYFELFFDLYTGANTASAFSQLLDALATGWEIHRCPNGDDWAIWVPSDLAGFVAPHIRWANLECYSEACVEKTILILEDDHARIERFKAALSSLMLYPKVLCWQSARRMIDEAGPHLASARLISLDHDLYPLPPDTQDPGDGLDVARFLAANRPACPIIIHSSNADRARIMAGELELAGCHPKLIAPLGPDWIEAHWAKVAQSLL